MTGLGPVGLSSVMLSVSSGAEVLAVDLIEERLDLAQQIGARHTVRGGGSALEQVMALTYAKGTEVCIDCSGSNQGRLLCLRTARNSGRVVYPGEGGAVTFEPSPLLLHKKLSLYGSWVCGLAAMEELAEHLVRRNVHPQRTPRPIYAHCNQLFMLIRLSLAGRVGR